MLTDTIYRSMRGLPELQRQFKRVLVRLPHRQRQIVHFGQRLWVDPSELHGFHLYYEREYDDYIFHFLSQRLGRYRRVLDIGANIGVYTLFFAARVASVDSFEPERRVLPKLKANLALNGLVHVNIHECCVADVSGKVNFHPADRINKGVGSITQDNQGVQYPSITLDDFFEESIHEPCFIKMDIEGGEWLALQGSQRVFRGRKAPVSLLIEIHPSEIKRLGGSVAQLESLLMDMGFRVHGLTPAGLDSLSARENCRFWWVDSNEPGFPI